MANDSAPPTSNGVGYGQATNEPRHENHIYKERHMKIICIGAGASGLLLAYKLQRSFQNFELILYEKNDEIAGTWYENRYPGQVPSIVTNPFYLLLRKCQMCV